MNVDLMIAEAMRRIAKNIERRCRIALGEKPATVNRSTGQKFKRKERTQ